MTQWIIFGAAKYLSLGDRQVVNRLIYNRGKISAFIGFNCNVHKYSWQDMSHEAFFLI